MKIATALVTVLVTAPLTALTTVGFAGDDPGTGPTETPRGFQIHTTQTAPEASRAGLEAIGTAFGFVPNLAGVMSNSPALLSSYLATQDSIEKLGTLSPAEVNVIQLTMSMENQCRYCVSGHTLAGKLFFQTPDEVMDAIRKGEPIADPKLRALHEFTLSVVAEQGRVTDAELQQFLAVGYDRSQALEVIASIAAKMMSNFTNQLVGTPIDEAMQPFTEGLNF